jgi:hypothetical protein
MVKENQGIGVYHLEKLTCSLVWVLAVECDMARCGDIPAPSWL